MHGAAADSSSVFQRLSLRVESGKSRQQTWMNVEDAATIRINKFRRQHAHVAGQTNQIDLSACQRRHDFTIVFLARARATFNHERFNSTLTGALKTGSVALI